MELNYLKNYHHRSILPKWFVDYEESDITYFAFELKISEPMLMKRMRNIDKPILKDYYNFLMELPHNNEAAIISIYYYLFLNDYYSMYQIPFLYANKNDTSSIPNWDKDFITYSQKNYNAYISDILLARNLDLQMGIGYVSKETYTLFTDAIHRTDLKQYLEKRYLNRYVLKEGDMAPYFYLKNERNESVSLNQFEGNIVYISFWFTGCKPCLKEIPDENHLADVFKNENVKIVSICMQSSEESWRQIIKKNGVTSITLFSKGNWDKLLKEKYDIESFPHHVLIDKHGKIILNKCQRPAAGAEQEIRNWLDKQ
jgi:peroxiredoxin